MPEIRRHLSFANAASALALLCSTGVGGAYAAAQLAPNSVGSTQLRNGAVKTVDLGSDAVTGAKVENRSLAAVDFASGQLPRGARGPAGDAGQPAYAAFASVNDGGGVAVLAYGPHAVGVSDPSGPNTFTDPYVVTFDRSLSGCVVSAVAGVGSEESAGVSRAYGPYVMAAVVSGSTVQVVAYNGANPTHTSFMLAVFC